MMNRVLLLVGHNAPEKDNGWRELLERATHVLLKYGGCPLGVWSGEGYNGWGCCTVLLLVLWGDLEAFPPGL
jgi:hypothetical protein